MVIGRRMGSGKGGFKLFVKLCLFYKKKKNSVIKAKLQNNFPVIDSYYYHHFLYYSFLFLDWGGT